MSTSGALHASPATSIQPVPASPQASTPASPLAGLWKDAVERYEKTTGVDLAAYKAFDSEDAIGKHVQQHESDFTKFRADGPQELRSKIKPIAATVQTLCGVFGEAVTMPYSPVKAVFAAIGVIIQASRKISEDFDAVVDAFDTMEHHLRIIKPIAAVDMHDALKEASVKLLGQILVVLGVITNLQKNNRLKLWLKKLCQSKDVPSALDELGRLATNHHQTMSAVTLHAVNRTLTMLENSRDWHDQDQNFTRRCLGQISDIARESHALLGQTMSSLADLTASRSILEGIQATLLRMTDESMKDKRSGDVDKICQWLRYPDCSVKLNSVMSSRVPGTGSWFLDGNDFGSFISGDVRVLWLHGQAGSGKSTMMAAAIRELQAHCASSIGSCITLTHLFDLTNGAQKQDVRALLSSLLCQLAYHRDNAREELLEVRDRHMDGHTQPSLEKMQHHLWRLVCRSPRLFVVVDALDEAHIDDLVPLLRALRAYSNISLLISSRTEVHPRMDLVHLSDVQVYMTGDLVKCDIETFLHVALADGGPLAHMSADFIELVQEKLGNGSAGNFRWASLQVKELASVAGIPALISEALENLSPTLGDFYDQVLSRIPKARCEVVLRLLSWLLFSKGRLSKAEFSELLAFSYPKSQTMPIFDPKLRPYSTDDVMRIISSTFVSYDGDCVRLSHASARDHLLNLPATSPFHIDAPRAKCHMTRMCLAYLLHVGADTIPEYRSDYPLHEHVAIEWLEYADEGLQRQKDLEQDLIEFVKLNKTALSDGVSVRTIEYAIIHRHTRVVRLLYTHLKMDVDAWLNEGGRPLHFAMMNLDNFDDLDIIHALIDAGVDVDDDGHGQTALHMACAGIPRAVEVLLRAGASTGIRNEHGETALFLAVGAVYHELYYDACTTTSSLRVLPSTEIVRLLLAAGADTNVVDNTGHTLLGRAVGRSHHSTDNVVLLLDAGATVNVRDTDGRTPLHIAVAGSREDMTRLLLDAGANVNIRDKAGRTALLLATAYGHQEVTRLLLNTGAAVHVQDVEGNTALHLCHAHFVGICRLLLDAGADVYMRNKTGMAALSCLSYRSETPASLEESFRLLLKAGADVNTRDDNGWTPLHHTVHATFYLYQSDPLSPTTGGQAMVRLLLAAGADRHTRDNCGKSPLDLAEESMESVVYSWDRPSMEEVIGLLRQPARSDTGRSDGMGEGATDGDEGQDEEENSEEQGTTEPAGADQA
ncbi:ankyrin repeat-containing domain protein [Schizophyllum amplum]|uniref:Ankyrin repeat-containing domain protein n=1 Tax=Schizophyllum amplum TaxID=97359 RepID=A0A550C4I2_9AGAR|nr:ankyrin repeat-containing domain protein [Auriculariopsis ampla]